jgi:hypothetical protein
MRLLTCSVAILLAMAAANAAPETAADVSMRRLLDAVEERGMPDMALAIVARIAADPSASADLKRELPFRRSAALVAISRREADGTKRAALLDEAQAALDEFLASGEPDDRQAIAAYTQKGTLLIERGRTKADQARRPGVDGKGLREEAVTFFDEGIAALKGTVTPDEPVTSVHNAEDAVIKMLRDVNARIEAIKGDTDAEPAAQPEDQASRSKPKPKRLTSRERQQQKRLLEPLAAERESLQAKLLQTRLLVADAVFKKADAYDPNSKDWTKTIEASTDLYKSLADKYPTMGGGLLALCYQGRNEALLGKRKQAVELLAPLTVLDPDSGFAVALRAKAMNITLECLLADKQYESFQPVDRDFALSDVSRLKGGRLDADWLGLKYRAAAILDARADALGESDPLTKTERTRLQADARKLATEVARANADFASEARSLAAKLGKVVAEGEQTFAAAFDEAKQSLGLMQASQAEARAASEPAKAEQARSEATAARSAAIAGLRRALALAGAADPLDVAPTLPADVSIDAVNEARYLLAYLLYDGGNFSEAAEFGRFLAERYPNAKGSRQAARIALACWQQLAQAATESEAAEPRQQAVELAGIMLKTWPDESETADAAAVAIAAGSAAHAPGAIVDILGSTGTASPRRAEILLRGGAALWREVQQARRLDEAERPADEQLTSWRTTATRALDESLASCADLGSLPPAPLGTLAAAGAIARGQIALDDGDAAGAIALLDQPVYGPWTLAGGPKPVLTTGSLAESALTLSLLVFIQTDDFTRAQEAMKRLEDVAGTGGQASAKLAGLYLAMGRDLQDQLDALAAEAGKGDATALNRARTILQGFTAFLDAVADRDQKTSSQIWVATTYLALGSGKGTGAVVPPAAAEGYLRKAATAYEKLLAKQSDPDVARFEPSIRLQLADLRRQLGDAEAAQEQIAWLLAEPSRRNSLEVQVLAAEVLQTAAEAAAKAGDAAAADRHFQEAVAGDKAAGIWGWAQIANRLERQGISGSDERSATARSTFFESRLKLAECLIGRARLSNASPEARQKRLSTADAVISMTRKLHPDLGGEAFSNRFTRLQESISQK